MNTNTNSSIAHRSWRLAVPAAVLVVAASTGSASAATGRTPSPFPTTPNATVQRMVKDCRDAMHPNSSGTAPMVSGYTGADMMDDTDGTGMMGGS